jgi:hypothetical protein
MLSSPRLILKHYKVVPMPPSINAFTNSGSWIGVMRAGVVICGATLVFEACLPEKYDLTADHIF